VIRLMAFLGSFLVATVMFVALVTLAGFITAIRHGNTGGVVLWAVLFVLVAAWLVALWKRRSGVR
jgi:hypothetical protein